MNRLIDTLARISLLVALGASLAACTSGEGGGQISNPTPTNPPIQPTPTDVPASSPTPDPDVPTPGGEMVVGLAGVESIEILILESFPVQVRAHVQGALSDACTRIGEVTQKRDGNTFEITITTARPKDLMCAQVITPFEESIALDVAGLKAGTYTVNVNGVSEQFTLATDNVLP